MNGKKLERNREQTLENILLLAIAGLLNLSCFPDLHISYLQAARVRTVWGSAAAAAAAAVLANFKTERRWEGGRGGKKYIGRERREEEERKGGEEGRGEEKTAGDS